MTQIKQYTSGILLTLLAFVSFSLNAQKGENTYEFLQLPNSARTVGLGGTNISLNDNDLSLSYNNPALLSDTLDKTLTINYTNYLTDINYGYSAFAKDFGEYGTFAAGVFYIDYGDFDGYDEYGNPTVDFGVTEIAFNISWGYEINEMWRVGASMKPVYSVMEMYKSFGLVFDFGTQYTSANKLFTAGFVMKNAGLQLTTYTENNRESVPFEMQLGFSQRLAHAPFRFSATYRHLQQFDIGYEETVDDETVSSSFGQLFMRHWVFGVEFLPTENVFIMGGYNTQRRYEMQVEENPGLIGFSWGAGVKISKFNITYGSAHYHLSGRTNYFSIATNLNRFM